MEIKTYSELSKLGTFEERYRYLRLQGRVGADTFGFDRWINQKFYQRSPEWKSVRNKVILRDHGCDLGVEGREIFGKVIVHHMNPLRKDDLETLSDYLLNPEYLICTTHETHNAIHYGDEHLLMKDPVERMPYDTCPWKRGIADEMLNINRRNVFYRHRHTILALSRVKGIDLRMASELWASDHGFSASAEKFEWFSTLDYCKRKNLLETMFEGEVDETP